MTHRIRIALAAAVAIAASLLVSAPAFADVTRSQGSPVRLSQIEDPPLPCDPACPHR